MPECRARLQSATDLRGLALSWDAEGPVAVMGEFRGPLFRLHTKNYYTNCFAPFFYGKFSEAEGGATLEGSFRMNPFIRLFLVFWLSFLVLFAAGAFIVPPPAHPASGMGRVWFFVPLVVLAILGVSFVMIGRWLGRAEQRVIHSFLKSTLIADDA